MSLSVFHLLLVIGMCTSATFPQDDKKTMIPPTNHGETILLSADATELTRLAGEAGHAYAHRDLSALERLTADD